MTAATACRTCGAEPRDGVRFCDACGSVIAAANELVERLTAEVQHYADGSTAGQAGAQRVVLQGNRCAEYHWGEAMP